MVSVDGKVKQLADNILTLKDIRTRPALWFKPTDVSPSTGKPTYIDLRIYVEWPYWTREYNFLPLPKLYGETIKPKVIQDLLGKKGETKSNGEPWKENGRRKELTHEQNTDKFPQVNYYLVKASNNTITIIFQNWKGYTLNRPNVALFWGENDKIKKIPNLYWVDGAELIDARKNFVQVKATLDPIWRDYGRFCESWGTAIVKKSTVGFYHNEHEDDKPDGQGRYDNFNPKGVMACPACNACFDFCGVLGNTRSCPGGYQQPEKATWQPKFKLAFIHPKNNVLFGIKMSVGGNSNDITQIRDEDTNEVIVEVPTNFSVQNWKGSKTSLIDIFFGPQGNKPFLLFLIDKEHEGAKPLLGVGPVTDKKFWEKTKNFHFSTLPKLYNEQPHMLNHSTVYIDWMKQMSKFSANLRHVMVRKIDGRLKMIYQVFRKSSIHGITYTFFSGEILFRWTESVKGSIQNTQNLLDDLLEGLFGALGNAFGLDKLAEKGQETGKGFFSGIKMMCVLLKEAIKGWVKKQVGTDLNNILTGEKYEKLIGTGVNKTMQHANDPTPQQEKQKTLKAVSTNKFKTKETEPSLHSSDSIQQNSDFWKFANSVTGKPFEIRYQHSNVLYDNLTNNNNLAPKQDIYCKFSAFKQLIKAGEFQGKVNLRYDESGWFSGILNRGTHFVETFSQYEKANKEEKKSAFPPFKYKGTVLQSFSFPPTSPTGNRQGIEKVIPGDNIDKKGPKNEGGDDVSIETTALYIRKSSYCRGPSGDVINELMQALLANGNQKRSEDSSCWYFSENRNDSVEVEVTEGRYDYKIFGFNMHGLDNAKGIEANYFTVAIRGTRTTGHVSIQAGLRKQSDPKHEYIAEKDDDEKEDQIVIQDYDQPTTSDSGTEIDTELDLDFDDDRDDQDLDDIDVDPDADEKESEDDMDPDIDKDKDEDKDRDDDVDSDIDFDFDSDLDDDVDFDKDKDKDRDDDDDTDRDSDADHSDKDDDKDTQG